MRAGPPPVRPRAPHRPLREAPAHRPRGVAVVLNGIPAAVEVPSATRKRTSAATNESPGAPRPHMSDWERAAEPSSISNSLIRRHGERPAGVRARRRRPPGGRRLTGERLYIGDGAQTSCQVAMGRNVSQVQRTSALAAQADLFERVTALIDEREAVLPDARRTRRGRPAASWMPSETGGLRRTLGCPVKGSLGWNSQSHGDLSDSIAAGFPPTAAGHRLRRAVRRRVPRRLRRAGVDAAPVAAAAHPDGDAASIGDHDRPRPSGRRP